MTQRDFVRDQETGLPLILLLLLRFQTIVRGSMIGHGDYITAMINDMSRLSVTSSNSLRKSSPSARKRAQSLGRLGEVREGDNYQYEGLAAEDEEDEDEEGGDEEEDEEEEGEGRGHTSRQRWRTRAVHSESNTPYLGMKKSITLQPNGILSRAKSTYEVGVSSAERPPPQQQPQPIQIQVQAQPQPIHAPSYGAYMSPEMGSPQERVVWRRDFQLPPRGVPAANQRPIACFYSPAMALQQQQHHHPHGDPGPVHPMEFHHANLPHYMQSLSSPSRPYSSYDLKVSLDTVVLCIILQTYLHSNAILCACFFRDICNLLCKTTNYVST